jgi:hypothetical protein
VEDGTQHEESLMRGYLIDSERQTIEEIDMAPGLEDVRRLLNCRTITTSRWLRGNMAESFDAIHFSRDYLADRHGLRSTWFQVDGDRTPPSLYPIAGNGFVHGVDADGRLCDVKVTLDDVRARITFAPQIIYAATG